MTNEKETPPERVWITRDDAYPWPTPEMGGTEYVRADLLATVRKEEREAAFKEIRQRIGAVNPQMTFGSANGSMMKKCILAEIDAALTEK